MRRLNTAPVITRIAVLLGFAMSGLGYGASSLVFPDENNVDRGTSGRWLIEHPEDGPDARKLKRDLLEDKMRSIQSSSESAPVSESCCCDDSE